MSSCSSPFFLVPLLLGGARGRLLLFVPLPYGGVRGRLPLANAAGDSQAGGDGGQDGCYCLNDEFPSFSLLDRSVVSWAEIYKFLQFPPVFND